MAGCGTVRRTVTREASDVRIQESTEVTARDSVVVELRDTLVETTTITIDRNEVGDTLKVVQVTDRDRVRDHTGFKVHDSRVTVKRDTVYVERRDSVRVYGSGLMVQGSSRASPFVRAVKWVVAVMVVICILIKGWTRRVV